ncbi:hypothetical protein OSTOST_21418, partial [Ostertagia ostertagi]
VDALFTHGDYDKAISLYQTKLNQHFDVDSLINFNTLKKKIAFRYIEEQKFEKAADLLISTEVNPEEVLCLFTWPSSVNIMSNNVVLHDGYQFLEEYLMQVREMHFALQSRAMWLLAGETSKAWDFWRRLCCGELEDATFNLDDVVERIPSITDKKLLQDVLTWIIRLSPERCMEIIVSSTVLDCATVRKMLDGDAKLLRIYLESVPFSEEIAKELCDLYIKDIHSGDLNCRHRFRRLLLNMSFSDRTAVYDRIPSGCGVERLLCDNSVSLLLYS